VRQAGRRLPIHNFFKEIVAMDPNQQPSSSPPPVRAEVVGQPYPGVYARRPRPLRTLLTVLFLAILLPLGLIVAAVAGVLVLNAAIANSAYDTETQVQEKYFSHQKAARDKVAIITIDGLIVGGDGFVRRQIERARRDDSVKAVVLRVDSPGGTINGSDYYYHHLRKLVDEDEKPLVVSMGGLAASGGYYVSMAVGDAPESIFAEPTTWTGSIGVIIPLYQAVDLMDKLGVKENSIASGPLKEMGSFSKPITPEEEAVFRELVDQSFTRFKDIIKQGRPKFEKDPEALDKLATGQIFTAEQALAGGLIDKIGFIEDAIDRAIELASLDEDDVTVLKYAPEPTLSSLLLGGRAGSPKLDLASMLELGSPRAYYLWTRLPPLMQSGR
jgi:protease-4